jgi:hypothetical protein
VKCHHISPRIRALSEHPSVHPEQLPKPSESNIGDEGSLGSPSMCIAKPTKQRRLHSSTLPA